jgi:dUTP pyrophosphatase
MAKRYYKVNERVWIKALKKTGRVVSLDIPNLSAAISFYEDGDLKTRNMKFMEIDKYKDEKTKVSKKVAKEIGKSWKSVRREPSEDTKKQTILVKYFNKNLFPIEKIEKGDWIDLRSAQNISYKAGDFIKLPLGVAMSLPFGYEAHIAPRGSMFKNFGVIQVNSPGVVDESYRGNDDQWFIPLYALRDGHITFNDRICQFRIVKKMEEVNIVTVEELKAPNRGGHGSTGVN